MKQAIKQIFSFALALLLLVPGLLTIVAYADNTATQEATEVMDGETFAVDKTYTVSKALSATPKTFEATIHLPKSYDANSRPGVIFGNYSNGTTPALSFELEKANKIRLYYNTGSSSNSIYFTYDVRSDDFITIAVTLDPTTNKAILYVNGSNITEQTTTAVSTFCDILPSNRFMIGGDLRTQTTNQQYFKGKIKSVSIYSDARTDNEIAADYANGIDTNDKNLLCAYNLTSKDPKVRTQDLSANKNNLIYSAPDYDNDKIMLSEGLSFSSENTYRVHKSFPMSTPIVTYEAEIYLPANVTGRGGVIFGNYSAGKWSTNLEIYEAGKPRLYFENNGGTAYNFVFDKVDVRVDKWVHLAIVLDAVNGFVYCYIDGSLAQTLSNNGPLSLTNTEIYKSSFYLGRDTRADSYFKGGIKSLAAYTDARTGEEITASMSGVDTNDENLLCAYYFKESTGRNDISGNNYHIYYNNEQVDNPDDGGTGGDEIQELNGLKFNFNTYAIVDKSLRGNLPLTFEATILLPDRKSVV